MHERIGAWLARYAGDGRLDASLLEGIVLIAFALAMVAVVYLASRSTPVEEAAVAGTVFVPLAVFAFFAGPVDAIHAVTEDAFRGANFLLTIVEDGGELVAISLALALIVHRYSADLSPALRARR